MCVECIINPRTLVIVVCRDDFLSCINSSFSSDFPPPLLVAIQFHWSYGAVQLLLHGADPATHWNNKLVHASFERIYLHEYCML